MVTLGDLIDSVSQQLPVPQTIFEGTWFFIGWIAGRTLGSKCDEDFLELIKDWEEDGKWARLKKFAAKNLVKLLNFIHHSWIGLLGIVYFGVIPIAQSIILPVYIPVFPCAEAFWFCLGMALEDITYHTRASTKDGILYRMGSFLSQK